MRKLLRIARHPVGKARAYGDQKIAAADSQIRGLCAVHSNHSGVVLICSVKRPLSHQRIADGDRHLSTNSASSGFAPEMTAPPPTRI